MRWRFIREMTDEERSIVNWVEATDQHLLRPTTCFRILILTTQKFGFCVMNFKIWLFHSWQVCGKASPSGAHYCCRFNIPCNISLLLNWETSSELCPRSIIELHLLYRQISLIESIHYTLLLLSLWHLSCWLEYNNETSLDRNTTSNTCFLLVLDNIS